MKIKQKWTPKETHNSTENFLYLVVNNLNNVKIRKTKISKANLTKKDKTAMEELAKRVDIIIENTDKGRTLVIMNTDHYINEAICEMSDRYIYKQLRKDPT